MNGVETAVTGIELFARGMAAGLIIAAPVGPVNVLCIHRTVTKGWRAGLSSGLGAATADSLYGSVAAFSITLVIQFLIREEFWIRLFGGVLLVLIGAWYFFKRPQEWKEEAEGTGRSDYMSTFLLTLTNPTTVLSFLAVLAALGLGRHRFGSMTAVPVAGIFSGSMLWWTILVTVVNRLRDRITSRTMLWMNRIAGLAIGGFGVASFVLSRASSGR